MEAYEYPGDELALFEKAEKWKRYFASQLRPFIRGHVLEAGAGIGGTTAYLLHPGVSYWCMAEPDPGMAAILQKKVGERTFNGDLRVVNQTVQQVEGRFDTILYIDVLEHIEKDAQELNDAAMKLETGGHLIVLSPAFPFLFSPFDKAIGHYRRYTKEQLRSLTPRGFSIVRLRYLDSMGYLSALANKWLLRQRYPTQKQVKFWDSILVPLSRFTDAISFHSFGKTVIAVWQKTD